LSRKNERLVKRRKVTKLDNNEKIRFNSLYLKATNFLKGKVDCYEPLSTLEKLKVMEAIALFKECINIYPLSWQSHWAIGKAYQSMGKQIWL